MKDFKTYFIFNLFIVIFIPNVSFSQSKIGSIIDLRDGNKYKTIQIGTQIWMAENLRFDVPKIKTNNKRKNKVDTFFLEKENQNFGRYYDFKTANKTRRRHHKQQGICPQGWHIPSKKEWTKLIQFLNSPRKDSIFSKGIAGLILKSKYGWEDNPQYTKGNLEGIRASGNGTNGVNFNALPTGHYWEGGFDNIGTTTSFWTSTKINSKSAVAITLRRAEDHIWIKSNPINIGLSCRCIKNKLN